MLIAIYMDVHVPRAITLSLPREGVDVRIAQEDEPSESLARNYSAGLHLSVVRWLLLMTVCPSKLIAAGMKGEFSAALSKHIRHVLLSRPANGLTLITQVAEPGEVLNQVRFLTLPVLHLMVIYDAGAGVIVHEPVN